MPVILDGKKLSSIIFDKIAKQTAILPEHPRLAIVLVGNNPASEIYVRNKISHAQSIGINTKFVRLEANSTKIEIFKIIKSLNKDSKVNGIIVQAPLPNRDIQEEIFESIDPKKDVDGFTAANIGGLCNGRHDCLVACTPLGILELLTYYKVPLTGKHVVILGRSRIVGRPLSILLSQTFEGCNATVTLCNSKTSDLSRIARSGDILISAIGKPRFVTQRMIKDGAVLVDVGISRVPDDSRQSGYRICGDVDFENVYDRCSAVSPVPGGVGPMTIAMLMQNTLKAYNLQNKKDRRTQG